MAIKLSIVGLLICVAMFFYLVSALLALIYYLVWVVTSRGRRSRLASSVVYALGFLAAAAAISLHWREVGHVPLQNLFEVFLCLGTLIYPISLFCRRFLKVGGEPADALIGFLVLFPAAFVFSEEPQRLPPALQSFLFVPHVSAYMLSYVIMAKAAVPAFARLLGWEGALGSILRGKGGLLDWVIVGLLVPPVIVLAILLFLARALIAPLGPVLARLGPVLARLLGRDGPAEAGLVPNELAGYRMVCLGFPLLTMGLVLGAWWGKLAWGDYWNWDPKELWSLVSWLVFLGYFHFRHTFGTRFARANALFIVSGLLAIFVTLLWVNLARIFAGLHSYAG